jgi:hypothetical protein
MARIDAPSLDSLRIALFYEGTFDICDISQLGQFIRHTARFQALNEAHVDFNVASLTVTSYPPSRTQIPDKESGFSISSGYVSWDLPSLMQVLTSFISSICIVEHLYIYGPEDRLPEWGVLVEDTRWLENFHPFTAVKNLYLRKHIAQFVSPALQEPDVLPVLEGLLLEELEPSGPVEEAIWQFVAARHVLGHHVAVSHWNWT